jgi:DDE superfamily endonuclease
MFEFCHSDPVENERAGKRCSFFLHVRRTAVQNRLVYLHTVITMARYISHFPGPPADESDEQQDVVGLLYACVLLRNSPKQMQLGRYLGLDALASGLFGMRVGGSDGFEIPRISSPPEQITISYTKWALEMPEQSFYDIFRMLKPTFKSLCKWLRKNTPLRSSRRVCLEQKVLVFLYTCAFNEPQSNTSTRFHLAQSTVSVIMQDLLKAMALLHTQFVRQPDETYVSKRVELDPKFNQFNGAIGAVDGTHILAFIPIDNQQRFWLRKNAVSQNVFAAVTFDSLFTYVLAGVEGSFHDSRVLDKAISRSFRPPTNRFYLADAGFPSRTGIMPPFAGTYHLRDFELRDREPQNEKEYFNLRPAQLRNVVERVFGQLKRKWSILKGKAPEYSLFDQVQLVYGLTALHNFIKLSGRSLDAARATDLRETPLPQLETLLIAADRADEVVPSMTMVELRKSVTGWLWEAREEYLGLGNVQIGVDDVDEG